jgi:hypothetical protein
VSYKLAGGLYGSFVTHDLDLSPSCSCGFSLVDEAAGSGKRARTKWEDELTDWFYGLAGLTIIPIIPRNPVHLAFITFDGPEMGLTWKL